MLRLTSVTSLALACATVLLVVPHAWPVTTDAARAAVTVVQTALVWPVVLYHSALPVRLLALVFAALGCVQQAFVLGINTGEFYPHLIPGLLLMRGGVLALGSSGLPFPIAASQGVCTLAVLLLLAVGQWYQTLLGRGLHVAHVAHELMFIVVGCLVLTGTLQSVLPAPRAAQMQEARRLLDPICYAALGVLFLSHIHDKSAVGTAWHVVLGWALIGQAAALLLASFVHAHNPPQGVASLANACVAYAWVMPGVWLIHMASFHYLFARGWHNDVDIKQGVHHLLWPGELATDAATVKDDAKAREYIGVYLTVDLLFSAALVLAAILGGSNGGRGDLIPSKELDDDGDLPLPTRTHNADNTLKMSNPLVAPVQECISIHD